jgi:hypothetical protein
VEKWGSSQRGARKLLKGNYDAIESFDQSIQLIEMARKALMTMQGISRAG